MLAHGFYSNKQIRQLIYFYFYKNGVLVGSEILFQFVSGFSRERFFIGIWVTCYNLVLSTLQSLIAIMLENRDRGENLQMAQPELYHAAILNDSATNSK